MGILFMKLHTACPKCGKNIFGRGMYKLRNRILFSTRFSIHIRKNLKCHNCWKEVELSIEKGRYRARIAAD